MPHGASSSGAATALTYSMGMASRPISCATSSRRPGSLAAMARASRSRHSSSLRWARNRGGTTEDRPGTRWARISGMESPVEHPTRQPTSAAIGTNWRRRRALHGAPRAEAREAPMPSFGMRIAAQDAAGPRFLATAQIGGETGYFFYASESGFVIRCALANICVACSSVAQR